MAADRTSFRFVLVTLDHHASAALREAGRRLAGEVPGFELAVHAASDWDDRPEMADRCIRDLETADLVVVSQLFLEAQVLAIRPVLERRRDELAALVCVLSAPELVRLTRLGRLDMSGESDGAVRRVMRRWREHVRGRGTAGERQMRMLRLLPRLLRYLPGTAQDLRAYLLTMSYWLAGSTDNLANLIRFLVAGYGRERISDRASTDLAMRTVAAPMTYPDVGLYHPDLPGLGITEDGSDLPRPSRRSGRVGLLLMRSYLLSGDTAHYDAVIRALEARGLSVVAAFTSGLDARPAIERYFLAPDAAPIDALVSLTGFSLVGGPAYNDAEEARRVLAALDVPYQCLLPLEFQTIEAWQRDPRGLSPLQSALMVSVPELDGATAPTVYSGRGESGAPDVRPVTDRVEAAAERLARLAALRRTPAAERRLAVVLFNFPPNVGSTGTAAFLSVFASLHRLLIGLRDRGYDVDVPPDPEALRRRIVEGNAGRLGTTANVHARVSTDDHVRNEPWLAEIERAWGPAPGKTLSDGRSLFVLGERFGNVFVGVQPPFGYEGDPMRLLFEQGFAPTHAFSAFYRWIREDFGADACLHFGTHGAVEFMPGKHVGLSGDCWPERLQGALPNFYVYAANNPSEGTLAKRRSGATLLSHLTPPVGRAGLYRGLLELKDAIDRFRGLDPADDARRDEAIAAIRAGAEALDLSETADPDGSGAADAAWADPDARIERLRGELLELEYSLIPHGLHVLGRPPGDEERAELLLAIAEAGAPGSGVPPLADLIGSGPGPDGTTARDGLDEEAWRRARAAAGAISAGGAPAAARDALGPVADSAGATALLEHLAEVDRRLRDNVELDAIFHALDGGFVAPAPGGDVLRTLDVLPTGRNLYGFDPHRVPGAFAMAEGRRQADRLLARRREDTGASPESLAMVLWGTDNLKTGGEPVALALALMGAKPRFDGYGRLCGAELLPLEDLGRPRVDVVVTTSGVFRDLLPLQMQLLAEAAWLAASADEPPERNHVRARALAHAAELDCDLETAALRVFSNADGAYGANVNHLVEGGTWTERDELAETYLARKGTAYDRHARATEAARVFRRALTGVECSYQNLDAVESGVSDLDQYVDSLGGLSRAATHLRGAAVPAYIGDQTRGRGRVRSLEQQIALEARTRTLNPRWYEAMLAHGHQGVREIETRVTNHVGWSATTGSVAGWVYDGIAETYVLDADLRERMAALNPSAAARLADRLLEAGERGFWNPDDETLEAVREAADELEDRVEGIEPEIGPEIDPEEVAA